MSYLGIHGRDTRHMIKESSQQYLMIICLCALHASCPRVICMCLDQAQHHLKQSVPSLKQRHSLLGLAQFQDTSRPPAPLEEAGIASPYEHA